MEKENKKRDPMPPPDATPEEIGEFWDTHSLSDYWDETQEVEFQVDLKSEQNQTQSDETKPDLPATTEDEANPVLDVVSEDTDNTGLDTIADLVSSLNLPIWVARNASKAFRQLCSAAVEWPSAIFKGKAAERQAITEANTKITETVTNQIIQQIEVTPEYAQIAVNKHMEKIIGEQINLDKTCIITTNELREVELDASANKQTSEPNRDEPANSTDQTSSSREEKTISDIWLNIFETEARPQSTEEGQLLFGRILAGEIKQPGSYSIKAVKTLGELDHNIATLFKKLCSACVAFGVFGTPNSEHVIDVRVPALGGNPGSNTLSKYGLDFSQLNILNEYGLIISDYNSRYDYKLSVVNGGNPVVLPFKYQEKSWVIFSLSEQDNKSDFRLSGVALSRVGRELFHIVDQDPIPEYTEDLKKYFAGRKLQMIEVPNTGPVTVNL